MLLAAVSIALSVSSHAADHEDPDSVQHPGWTQSSRVVDNDLWLLRLDGRWAVQNGCPLQEGVDHGLHHLIKKHGGHLGVKAGSEFKRHLNTASVNVLYSSEFHSKYNGTPEENPTIS